MGVGRNDDNGFLKSSNNGKVSYQSQDDLENPLLDDVAEPAEKLEMDEPQNPSPTNRAIDCVSNKVYSFFCTISDYTLVPFWNNLALPGYNYLAEPSNESTLFERKSDTNEPMGKELADDLSKILREHKESRLKYVGAGSYFASRKIQKIIRSIAGSIIAADFAQGQVLDKHKDQKASVVNASPEMKLAIYTAVAVTIPLVLIAQEALLFAEKKFRKLDSKIEKISNDIEEGRLSPEVKQFLFNVLLECKKPPILPEYFGIVGSLSTGIQGVRQDASFAGSVSYGAAIGMAASAFISFWSAAGVGKAYQDRLTENSKDVEVNGQADSHHNNSVVINESRDIAPVRHEQSCYERLKTCAGSIKPKSCNIL